jgi:NAD-dependent deacetylase
VGTSALVHPAAGLPILALHSGARLIEINPEATPLTPYAEAAVRGASGEILPIIERALGSRGE